ncbi:hypothetical protein LCGC14_1926140 [marine sediment metagenome]|uniref:Uncharacterized protein n=1 Tax=marine sediment metagenome TaxID=412755 RepID=A0A0F9FP96_9ZZZZ
MAVCGMALKKYAEAAKEFQALRVKYPKGEHLADATYRNAFCLHKLGKYDDSLKLCKTAAASKAFQGPATELIAENLFLLGRYPQAAKVYTTLAKTAKGRAGTNYAFRLGECAYLEGDLAKAVKLLGTLAGDPKTAKDPDLREAIFLFGDALLQTGQHAQAAAALARYVGLAKQVKDEARFKLALAQLRSGKEAEAARTLLVVMQSKADSTWVLQAMFEYGQLTYKQKQPAKAAQVLAKVVASVKAPAELVAPATYLLGWIDLDAGRYPQAAARFGQVVKKFPKHALAPEAAFRQGVALLKTKRYAEALTLLQGYIKANPKGKDVHEARFLTATCLAKLLRHAEAAKILASLADDKDARSETVLYELAWSQRKAKDRAAAAGTYRKLLAAYPSGQLATTARVELGGMLYQDKKFNEAADLLAKALADTKGDPKTLAVARYQLGWCYAKLDKHDKAAETFEAFAAKNAKDELAPSALHQAGLAFSLVGNHAKAQAHFAKLVSGYPAHELAAVTYLKLGQEYNAAGDYEKAATTFATFVRKFPKDKFIYVAQFGTGWSLESRKKYAEARTWYAKVTSSHNGQTAARAQFQTGESYFAEGKLTRAAGELIKVDIIYAYPQWSARALYEAGRVFEQLKRPAQAKAQYELCVKKYASQPVAKLAQKRLEGLGKPAS